MVSDALAVPMPKLVRVIVHPVKLALTQTSNKKNKKSAVLLLRDSFLFFDKKAQNENTNDRISRIKEKQNESFTRYQ